MNTTKVFDTLGLFGPFMFVAFIGTFVVTPIVLFCFYTYGNTPVSFGNVAITSLDEISFILVYVGITVGVAAVGGILNSIFLRASEMY